MRERRLKPGSLVTACFVALLVTLQLSATITPADASSDMDCDPDIRVKHAAFTRCNIMMAMSPGNDTRANLLLLLFDRDAPPPDFVPPRSTPLTPLPPDAVPLLFWSDVRPRFYGPPSDSATSFAQGEGSRCRSDAAGTTAYVTALTVAPDLPADERAALVAARKAFSPKCPDTGSKAAEGRDIAVADLPSVHSRMGQAFATYLLGAKAFYAGRFQVAQDAFGKLHGDADAWLGNTADYMVARTDVNRLQVNAFDTYGEFAGSDHVSQDAASRATASLESYLHDHPDGSYAASARGLQRRVFWLSGRKDALASAYTALIARPLADRGIDDAALAEEIDSKLLPVLKPDMTRDPILLATLDLRAMRDRTPADRPTIAEAGPPRVDLESQRGAFATAPALFDYIEATQAFYVDHDPNKVLELLPDDTRRRGGDHLWFSRQVLRGLALEAKTDRNTRGFWKELYPGATRPLDQLTVQLALALHDERSGNLDDVFAPGSIVTSPRFRDVLLDKIADATLLRRVSRDAAASRSERAEALNVLLWKEVSRAHYADFVADVALVRQVVQKMPVAAAGMPDSSAASGPVTSAAEASDPANKGAPAVASFVEPAPGELDCPLLRLTAAQLARDPRDVRARLCLAEFVRLDNLDRNSLDSQPSADDLGGGPTMFPGKAFSRADTYKAIIDERDAAAADRAYALYRAISCYAPASVNSCGGPDAPKTQRKAWYYALKRDYPTSRWAEELTYWW